MNRFTPHAAALLLTATGLSFSLTACQAPLPRGDDQGREDLYSSTHDESHSDLVNPVVLLEWTDEASREFVQRLADNTIPQIRDTQGRVTVVIGEINNQTGIVPSSDFRAMSERLRTNLINNPISGERFIFRTDRSRLARVASDENIVNPDGTPVGPGAYDARTTYILDVDVHRIGRGDTNYYYMTFSLVHAATGEILSPIATETKQLND